jgi:hypothetical protein
MSLFVPLRTIANGGAPERGDREETGNPTVGWQDKRPHIAARSVDWNICVFWRFAHIAAQLREVRSTFLSKHFKENCTSRMPKHA